MSRSGRSVFYSAYRKLPTKTLKRARWRLRREKRRNPSVGAKNAFRASVITEVLNDRFRSSQKSVREMRRVSTKVMRESRGD